MVADAACSFTLTSQLLQPLEVTTFNCSAVFVANNNRNLVIFQLLFRRLLKTFGGGGVEGGGGRGVTVCLNKV